MNRPARKIIFIAVSVVLVVAIGCYWWASGNPDDSTAMDDMYTTSVSRGDIHRTVYGSGAVEPAVVASVYAPTTATILTLYKETGDTVKAGEAIAELSGDALKAQISDLEQRLSQADVQLAQAKRSGPSTLKAPAPGRIKLIHAEEDEQLDVVMRKWGALMVLSADGLMKVDLQSSEPVEVGAKVTVVSGAKTVDGTVLHTDSDRITVTVSDEHFDCDTLVSVRNEYGAELGQGRLMISSPLTIIGYAGTVKSISVDENDKVTKDSTLLSVEDADYSEAYLSQLRDRESLVAELTEARENLERLTLYAPFDGVINHLTLTEKSPVQEDQLIYKIEQMGQFKVVVDIDELDIAGVQLGQSAEVKLAALDNQILDATVTRISSVGQIVGGVTSYPTTLLLNDSSGIYAGLSANADVLVEHKENVLMVPVGALKTDGEGAYVTVVSGSERARTTTDVPVVVGINNGTHAEITGDLREGDMVEVVYNASADLMQSIMETQRKVRDSMSDQ